MSERDEKIIAAMAAYDAAPVESAERILAARVLEKASAGIDETDFYRIKREYGLRERKGEA